MQKQDGQDQLNGKGKSSSQETIVLDEAALDQKHYEKCCFRTCSQHFTFTMTDLVENQLQESWILYFRGLAPRGAYRFSKFLVGRLVERGR